MKTIITEMKNTLNSISNQLDIAQATIYKSENITIETVRNETDRKKSQKDSISELWDNFRQVSIYLIGIIKFKKIEIISSIFSDHNVVLLDVNYRKNIKITNIWRLNNTLLNNHQIMEDIKGNQNVHRNKWKWKHENPKPMGFSKSSAKGNVHSNTSLPQEKRKIK